MNLQPVSAHYSGQKLPCVDCKNMIAAEKLVADLNGRAFMDYYCPICAHNRVSNDCVAWNELHAGMYEV